MIFLKFKKSKIFTAILLVISIGYLLLFCHPLIISSDETFTLSLIHHTLSKVIYLDSLDVHPPLYYLLLKIFIGLLTFWTNSVVIKVMVARLFSILVTMLMFIYLTKYAKLLGFKFNNIILWIMFLLLPNVLGIRFLFQQMTNIRMYALAALFTTMLVYYLFKYCYKKQSTINWILFTLSAIAAAYTHYYAAMFVGLLVLIYLVKSVHDYKNGSYIKGLSISLGLLVVSYLPWLRIFYKQFINTHTYWMNYKIMCRDLVIYLILFGIFVYPIYKYCQQSDHGIFKQQVISIVIDLTTIFILTVGISVVNEPIFLSRYFYPLLVIYEFLGLCSIYDLAKNTVALKINLILIVAMLLLNGLGSAIYQIHYFDMQNLQSEKIENTVNDRHSPVKLRCNNKLSLLQGYVYILYRGNHRYFNLKNKDITHPIIQAHKKTYSNITNYINNN